MKSAVALIIHSPVPIVMLWGEDGFMIYNDAYSVFAGGRHPKLLGRKVREAWPEVADFNDNVMKVGLAGGTLAYRNQELTLHRHGVPEQVWMNLDYSPVFDDRGEPAGVIAIVVETTEQVLAERRLAQESARQRRLFRQAPGFITILRGPEHMFEFVNEAYLRLFGGRDFVGKTVREAFPELAGQGYYEWLDNVYATGERFIAHHVPVRLKKVPGAPPEDRFLDFIYEPVTDEAGTITGIFCEGYDVTDAHLADEAQRRHAETLEAQVTERTRELQTNQARLRAIFETSFGFQSLLDLEGTLLDANATSLEAIGATLDDVIGRPFWDTPWFAGTPGMVDTIRRAVPLVASGQIVRQEIHVHLPIGGWRWFDFAIRPIRNADGIVVSIAPEAVETTERRNAEEAARQSQKLEAMGQLTGGVAHDFNNLLTPIFGSLDMLQRRHVGGEREQRLIAGGLQAAERARTLVQRLLAFARRQPLQPSAVDLASLVAGMADLIASTLGPKIRVRVDVAQDLPSAQADPNQLEMAILNLSVNARDAMPKGGTLTISAAGETIQPGHRSKLPAGAFVRLSVADTGIGMDEAMVGRAIEPFFSTKGIGKGTGLGLSMVHGLMSQLGGALVIISAPQQGTTVEMWLPVSTEVQQITGRWLVDRPDMNAVGIILLVDDEDLVRMTTADMLLDLGYEVVEATSAEGALRLLDDGLNVDVLITDHLMPGMTGADLARAVQQRRPGTPVLLVSGFADADDIAADLPRLTKPFRQADLVASVAGLALSTAK